MLSAIKAPTSVKNLSKCHPQKSESQAKISAFFKMHTVWQQWQRFQLSCKFINYYYLLIVLIVDPQQTEIYFFYLKKEKEFAADYHTICKIQLPNCSLCICSYSNKACRGSACFYFYVLLMNNLLLLFYVSKCQMQIGVLRI